MKKNTVKVIVAVVVLLVLVGATALLMMPSDNKDTDSTPAPTSSYTTYTIYSEAVDNVKNVTVEKADGNINAVKDSEGRWLINSLKAKDIDTSKSRSFVEGAINLTTTTLISENASELSEYGLDVPSANISITKNDGTVSKILIGGKSPVSGEYFVKNETDNKVYALSSYRVESLMKPESYYTEFERFAVEDVSAISKIEIKRSDVNISMEINPENNTGGYYTSWKMTSPINADANADYITNNIFAKISEISLSEPITTGDFGFNNPTATLVLTFTPYDSEKQEYKPSYTETLVVGKMNAGSYFVQYKDTAYSVPADKLDFVNTTVLNLVSKLQSIFNIADVEKVEMKYDNTTAVLDIIHINEEDDLSFKLNGNDIDPDDAKKFYQSLIGVLMDGIYNGQELGDTVLSLYYKGYNGKVDNTIEFKSISELECAIVKNGEAQFTVSRSIVNQVIDTINSHINR